MIANTLIDYSKYVDISKYSDKKPNKYDRKAFTKKTN